MQGMRHHLKHRRRRTLTLEPIEPRRLMTFAAELVADVNSQPYYPSTDPTGIVPVHGVGYYAATTAAAGHELWRSDGTLAGTWLVDDIVPGISDSYPLGLTNLNGTLLFSAQTPSSGRELWRSDGTADGTVQVTNIGGGPSGAGVADLINANGTLYFEAYDPTYKTQLWKSDGTAGGTVRVSDITTSSGNPFVEYLTYSDGLVYFVAPDSADQPRLWRSDGSTAGTLQIGNADSPGHLTAAGSSLFFTQTTPGNGNELWVTTGTAASTQLVDDIQPGTIGSTPVWLTNVNNTLLFSADDGQHGRELWKSDGTTAGTVLVRDLDVGQIGYPASFDPTDLLNFNGVLYFTHGQDRSSIWKSDGTESGTVPVAGAQNDSLRISGPLTPVGSTLYFANRTSDGVELWSNDGTNSGTVEVKDIYPGYSYNGYQATPHSSYPDFLTNVGGKLLFRASDANGAHLWASQGTAATTLPKDDVDVHTYSGQVQPDIGLNGKLLFTGTNGASPGLWASNGTGAGTQELKAGMVEATDFANINGTVYFSGYGQHGRELWKSNGTAAGTVLVKDINPGSSYSHSPPAYYEFGSRPAGFTAVGGKVVFAANDGSTGREIWVTDGSTNGTSLLKDIYPGGESNPDNFIKLGNTVYFTALGPAAGIELWRTDGTFAGTQRYVDIYPGTTGSTPQDLIVFKNKLYFSADDGVHGRELWESDGTAAGTLLVKDLTPGSVGSRLADLTEVRGTLYFTTADSAGNKQLWKSDGTTAGTTEFADIGQATELTNGNGLLFFTSDLGGDGRELFRSNGTASGTIRQRDIFPGSGSSNPTDLQGLDGVLFFEATAPSGQRGIWMSNGTWAGTVQVAPDAPVSLAQFLTNVGGQLYFAGTDDVHGQELWKFSTSNPVVQFSGSLTYREDAPPVVFSPWATIQDADNTAFPGGRLSVLVSGNAGPTDRVEIRNQGTAAGQISVSGNTIFYGGQVIGSYRAELPASRLIVDLTPNATVTATQALLRNVTFRAVGDNPGGATRVITVSLTDGSGGISTVLSKQVSVQPVNDPPIVSNRGASIAYHNNAPSILLLPVATVVDHDSFNFDGGLLSISIGSGGDSSNRLTVGGNFSVQGNYLLHNGVAVGAVLHHGIGTDPLTVRFYVQMNPALAQELLRSLRFATVGNTNLTNRRLDFTLEDGDGGVSAATWSKTVQMS
jgi:ELWxxDGT repeat protein